MHVNNSMNSSQWQQIKIIITYHCEYISLKLQNPPKYELLQVSIEENWAANQKKTRSVNCIERFGYFEKTFDEKKSWHSSVYTVYKSVHIAKYMQSNRFSFSHICVHTHTLTYTIHACTQRYNKCARFKAAILYIRKPFFLSRSSNAILNAETWDTISMAMKTFYSKSLQFYETTTTLHLLDCIRNSKVMNKECDCK